MVSPTAQFVHVVDDDPGARDSLQWRLEGEGLQVVTHAGGLEFLDAYRGESGCLVSDFRMPGMTGLELQEVMLARQIGLPLILITAYADVAVCRKALQRGAVDLIEKPVDNGLLLERIREALRIDALRREAQIRRRALSQKLASLTPREADVMQRLAQGATLKEIALACGIGFQTAAKHRTNALEKLGVDGDVELVRLLLDADGQSGGRE